MARLEDEELEKPETWDYGQPIRRRGKKGLRAIVSVAFDREDFGRVSECARRHGMKISEFIREAALVRVRSSGPEMALSSPSWTSVQYVHPFPPPTVTTRSEEHTSELH